MRIVILGPREPVPPTKGGAIEKLTWGLARSIVKQGHEAIVITTCERPPMATEVEGVKVVCISEPIKGSRFYFKEMPLFSFKARQIVENLAKDRNTILHSVYFYNLISFPSFNKLPTIITEFEHYPWIPEYLYHYPFISVWDRIRWESDAAIRISLARIIVNKAHIVTFVSNYQREMFLRKVNITKSKTIVIPNAVDTEFYRPMKVEDIEKLREGAEALLLFVGRLTPHKGLHILLKALALLEPTYKQRLKLVVVGPKVPGFTATHTYRYDTYSLYLNYLIQKHDLKNIVKFVGQVKEELMPLYYNSADALVHPSLVEAFGLVLIEAMACSKPVIAFDVPPINEIVMNNISGILVKPSIKSLKEILHHIIDNANILKAMGIRARHIVEACYSWPIISNIYINLYKKLMS